MNKILYGVCGEGLGHASRSKILINYLKSCGYDIKIIAGGKAYQFLSDEFESVEKIESVRFVYRGNSIRIFSTAVYTMYKMIFKFPSSFLKIRKIIKKFKPDLVITDAEPICHTTARLYGIKRVSIDNIHALLYRNYKVKLREIFSWITLLFIVRIGMFGADKYIVYDFSNKQISNKRVLFLNPLIQDGILNEKSTRGNHIFVYQTSTSTRSMCNVLKKIDKKFIIYGFNTDIVDGNLTFKKFNKNEFYHDLASAEAVITNGGFTVISEALYLKKPVFSLPINHQFEQILNGKFVERFGIGVCYTSFNRRNLQNFLNSINIYHNSLKNIEISSQKEILEKIEKEIKRYMAVRENLYIM